MIFSDAEISYLASQRFGRLATVQPDGTVQANPVGFTHNRALGTIDISGYRMAASQKFRNVAARPCPGPGRPRGRAAGRESRGRAAPPHGMKGHGLPPRNKEPA